MLSLIKIQKLCNLRKNHLSLMEMISDKNNNLDKLYYNEFSLRKTENQNERTGNRKKRKHRKKRLQHHNLATASLVQTYDNLKEHIETMRLVAAMGKPVETNVPHHFAFRGCDDVTYIVTGILAARMAKKCGVKNFVLQNMLNTPRSTWGVQDLAKSRAMLHIAKELEDDNFRIILQSRAGLDYFKPDLEAAKIQLASVTAMMDDIDPDNDHSPDIIHVVSYCEALYLATPDIINDSIKITRTALKEYRRLKKLGLTPDVKTDDIAERTEILETSARKILAAMEETIPDLYSPEGLYIAFVAGWLPVPELWSDSDEFIHAKCWETKMQNGGTHLVDHELLVPLETRINKCIAHNADAEYILKSKYKVLTRV